MKCKQARVTISVLVDQQLEENEEYRIMEHIKQCPACQAEWQEFKELRESCVSVLDLDVPYYFRSRLMHHIREQPVSCSSFAERLRRTVLPAGVVMALIVSLALGNYIGRHLYEAFSLRGESKNESVEVLDYALNNFPEGSLSDIYQNILNGTGNE